MEPMTKEEYLRFLSEKPRTGKIATVRADGRPHVAPIWFAMDGDNLMFNTWHATVKAANIKRDGRVAICIDDDEPPFRYAIIEGQAEILDPTPDELLHWATVIGGRYMGADRAEEFGKRNGVPGEHLIRVVPDKVITRGNIST